MALESTLAKRLFFGSIMIVVLIGLLFAEGWFSSKNYFILPESFQGILFALVAGGLAALGGLELLTMARSKGYQGCGVVMSVGILGIVLMPYWSQLLPVRNDISIIFFVIYLVIAAIVQAQKYGTDHTVRNLGMYCFVVVYIGLGFWFLVQIRLWEPSGGSLSCPISMQVGAVITFLFTVKSADIGAYFTGRAIGKHKWVPKISPAKTWEGFAGGIILAMIVSSLFMQMFDIINIVGSLLFGFIIGISGQLGDLLESMIKRDLSFKDSANKIPAFGGVMDLIDSVLIAAPFGYLFLVLYPN